MDNPEIKIRKQPEEKIKADISAELRKRGWYVIQTHGNMFQSGFPDLYATHSNYGGRWIEVKLPNMTGSKFTNAQLDVFPKLVANGSGVWILTAATEAEIEKLQKPCNLYVYLAMKG